MQKRKRKRKRRLLARNNLLTSVRCQFDRLQLLFSQGSLQWDMVPNVRSCWEYERSETWFNAMWANRFVDGYQGDRWKLDFRMSGATFDKLVTWLAPALEKEDTFLRKAIPIQKRVAIALWRLVNGDSFRVIAITFGVGKSTAVLITHEFCTAVSERAGQYIKFPQTPVEVGVAIEKFKEDVDCKIPQVFGAVDGTLIPIAAPDTPNKADYFARTKRYAVNTQGIIGSNLEFLHVTTGFPGCCHDSRVWQESSVFKKADRGEILNYPEQVIQKVRVKPIILGDGAYPLSTY